MVQITRRDDAMLDWLKTVRMADMDAIRWALAALTDGGADKPVGIRMAQTWVARLLEAGMLDRARPSYQEGQIVWASHQAIGRQAPNIYRQTTRHEVAVAAVSARYLARGYTWSRDRRPESMQDHMVDGIAINGASVDLIEVELTPKTLNRYRHICTTHGSKLADGTVSRVVYFSTREAARTVAREADKFIFRDHRHRLVTLPVFNARGKWTGPETGPWSDDIPTVTDGRELPTPELWDRQVVS